MKTLLLIRHANSSWGYKVEDDWDRPLSVRGKKMAPEMGKCLKEKKAIPQVILSSAATRARETCELLIDEIKYHGDVYYRNKLYMGEPEMYLKEIKQLPDDADSALVVGHNPGLEMLYQMICGEVESLPPASVACIQIPIETWKDFNYDCKSGATQLWKVAD